ncbi:MAG: ABC transporter permease [Chloroflexi bacterium]|nr:ABC transporter permease [Chloroflexota bacterium]
MSDSVKAEELAGVQAAVVEPAAAARMPGWRRALGVVVVPFLALFSGLVLSAFFVLGSDAAVLASYAKFFSDPGGALAITGRVIADAYGALFIGALGDPAAIANAIRLFIATGETRGLVLAFYPISESLVTATPYIFAGLAVALGFKCGLFNIGAEGQIYIGAIVAAFVGNSITGLPWIIHMPLTFIAAAVGGMLWGGLPGFLKAKTGAHEVINTMMMNYVAFSLAHYLLNGPMKRGGAFGAIPISRNIEPSAYFPTFFPEPIRFHAGFIVALLVAALVFWFLWKTTLGFEIRTVGSNPRAAQYAGISVTRSFILAMALSGALAAMAGAGEVMGVNHNLAEGFSPGYGFDSIALALLGGGHPVGVVLAALLFGTLRNGATKMQSLAAIPIDIISIVQAFVIMFVAAPAIIRWLYRIKARGGVGEAVFTRGWGG